MASVFIIFLPVLFLFSTIYDDVSGNLHHDATTDNATFFLDENHRVTVLKTLSGCYLVHLSHDQMRMLSAPDTLYKLESDIKDQVEITQTFHSVHQHHMASYNSQIQEGCKNIDVYTFHFSTGTSHHG